MAVLYEQEKISAGRFPCCSAGGGSRLKYVYGSDIRLGYEVPAKEKSRHLTSISTWYYYGIKWSVTTISAVISSRFSQTCMKITLRLEV